MDFLFDWFRNLTDPAKATIMAAFLGAMIAATIAFFTLILKDYLFPKIVEKRAAKKLRKDTFRKYGNPLTLSSIALLYRLKEVLNNRSHFLRTDSARNQFNEYKRISTLYRLCSLLGWMRASALELSYVEIESNKKFQKIQDAIFQVEKNLADGQHVELANAKAVCKILGWTVPDNKMEDLGYQLEILVHAKCDSNGVTLAKELDQALQGELISAIEMALSNYGTKELSIDPLQPDTLNNCIRALSRIGGLLYRDWQSAIGDLMIQETSNQVRRYFVMGYKEFEELYFSNDPVVMKWIQRCRRIFDNLDTLAKNQFDSRTDQLHGVYDTVYNLLEVVSDVNSGDKKIAMKPLKELPSTMKTPNNEE